MKTKLIIGSAALRRDAKLNLEMKIYNEMNEAIEAGSFAIDVCEELSRKYHICKSTIYTIRKRVERRLQDEKQHA